MVTISGKAKEIFKEEDVKFFDKFCTTMSLFEVKSMDKLSKSKKEDLETDLYYILKLFGINFWRIGNYMYLLEYKNNVYKINALTRKVNLKEEPETTNYEI